MKNINNSINHTYIHVTIQSYVKKSGVSTRVYYKALHEIWDTSIDTLISLENTRRVEYEEHKIHSVP